jgi:L-fuconolactonase
MAGKVDSHHHVWDLAVRDQPWTEGLPALRRSFSVDDLRPHLAKGGIERTVVVETVDVPGETPELLALASREAEVVGVVGWAELTAPDLPDRLASLAEAEGGEHLVGIRHQVQSEPDPGWLARPEVRRGLQALGGAGLVYDFVVRAHQLPAVAETVAALGEVRFVLDHGGKPPIAAGALQPWADDIRALSRLPNVAVKLSGLVTEADHRTWATADLEPYVEVLLTSFGPERVMWGSDWPVCLLAASYERWLATSEELLSALSPTEKDAVFSTTAERWYGLGGPRSA